MIPRKLRDEIIEELEALAMSMRQARDESEEAHCDLWLTSLAERHDELMGQYSAHKLAAFIEDERIQTRKVVDLATFRR